MPEESSSPVSPGSGEGAGSPGAPGAPESGRSVPARPPGFQTAIRTNIGAGMAFLIGFLLGVAVMFYYTVKKQKEYKADLANSGPVVMSKEEQRMRIAYALLERAREKHHGNATLNAIHKQFEFAVGPDWKRWEKVEEGIDKLLDFYPGDEELKDLRDQLDNWLRPKLPPKTPPSKKGGKGGKGGR